MATTAGPDDLPAGCKITIKTVKVFGVGTRVPRDIVLNPHG